MNVKLMKRGHRDPLKPVTCIAFWIEVLMLRNRSWGSAAFLSPDHTVPESQWVGEGLPHSSVPCGLSGHHCHSHPVPGGSEPLPSGHTCRGEHRVVSRRPRVFFLFRFCFLLISGCTSGGTYEFPEH